FEIGRNERTDALIQGGGEQPPDAVAPFPGPARFRPGEMGQACARMGVEHAKGGGFFSQVRNHAREDCVLDHLGEASSVVGVAIVHVVAAAGMTTRPCATSKNLR